MAGSINKVILVGNIGSDPEIRMTQNGSKVANMRVATSERWKDKQSGEMQERTEWHSVVVFNEHLVSVVERFVQKGSKLYVEGKLVTRKWQDQSGTDRYSTEVVLQKFNGEIQLLGSRQSDDNHSQSAGHREAHTNTDGIGGNGPAKYDDSQEIPF